MSETAAPDTPETPEKQAKETASKPTKPARDKAAAILPEGKAPSPGSVHITKQGATTITTRW